MGITKRIATSPGHNRTSPASRLIDFPLRSPENIRLNRARSAETKSAEYFEAVQRFVEKSKTPILLARPGGAVLGAFETQRPAVISGAGVHVIDYVTADCRVALLGTLTTAFLLRSEHIVTVRAELQAGELIWAQVRCIPLSTGGPFPLALLIWNPFSVEAATSNYDVLGHIEKDCRQAAADLREKIGAQLDTLRSAASQLGQALFEKGEFSTAEQAHDIASRLRKVLEQSRDPSGGGMFSLFQNRDIR